MIRKMRATSDEAEAAFVMSLTNRLRDVWRRAMLARATISLVAGFDLIVFVTGSAGQFSKTRTVRVESGYSAMGVVPGLLLCAYGGTSTWLYLRRRQRFEELAQKGFNTHAFGEIEEEIGELTQYLPLSYYRRFLEARMAYRRTAGERKQDRRRRRSP